jgi:glycerophosphoryl diester phosphodiesterase
MSSTAAVCAVLAGFAVAALAADPPGPAAPAQSVKIVIAHRGASGYLPEHTVPAIVLAHAQGADYLEQDVVLSKDDVPFVLHDVHIDTVTDVARRFPDRKRPDGRYYAIDFTASELKQLAASERFDPQTGRAVYPSRFPLGQGGFQVPTLEEELQVIQGLNRTTGREAGIYPEIKYPAWHRAQGRDPSRIVVSLLARYGYKTKADKIYLQCFEPVEVKRIRTELGYQGRLIQLIEGSGSERDTPEQQHLRTPAGLDETAKVADGIGPSFADLVARKPDGMLAATSLVRDAHARGLLVHPYTFRADAVPPGVASFDDLLRLAFFDLGVDGVFSDHPDRAVAFLRKR